MSSVDLQGTLAGRPLSRRKNKSLSLNALLGRQCPIWTRRSYSIESWTGTQDAEASLGFRGKLPSFHPREETLAPHGLCEYSGGSTSVRLAGNALDCKLGAKGQKPLAPVGDLRKQRSK